MTANQLNLKCYVDISDVNLENHTVIATIDLEIYGIENLTLSGISQKPSITCIQVSDSNNDELNCTFAHDFGNGTYSYRGILKNAQWYLYSMGEGYPYDLNFLEFNVVNLSFFIGETKYGASVFGNYSFDILTPQVKFVDVQDTDLRNNWQIDHRINGENLDIFFNRNTAMVLLIIMAPIAWLLFFVTMAPSLIDDRKTKIEVYSAILVFSPMFIFAIQNFLPPRALPSIPEFLSIILMLLATSFLTASLPKVDSKKSLEADKWIFQICTPIIVIWTCIYFYRLIQFSLAVKIVVALLVSLLLGGYIARVKLYNVREKRKEKEALSQFQTV